MMAFTYRSTCYLFYDSTVKVSDFVTSYEWKPCVITVKKLTFGAASEDTKAICSQPPTSLLTESADKHTEPSAVNQGGLTKTTRRRLILYLPSRKVGNLIDNYTEVPRSWNFKKFLSAQQTQVYLRLSWGSVHGWLLLFKYWSAWHDLSFSLCPY